MKRPLAMAHPEEEWDKDSHQSQVDEKGVLIKGINLDGMSKEIGGREKADDRIENKEEAGQAQGQAGTDNR